MRKFLIPIIMFLMLSTGCATPSIYVNGAPPTDRLLILQNPETGIQVFSQIVRSDLVREGHEEREDLIYLSPGEISLQRNTQSLFVTVRVLNEKRRQYAIWEVYDVVYHGEDYPHRVEHMLYSGKLSRKEISVSCPIKNVESSSFRIEIRDDKGYPIMVVGHVGYSLGNGGKKTPR